MKTSIVAMEELEDADSRRNSRIATASNSQSSCHVRETNVESKETRHQEGTKALSSETLKNLCRALNDPNVSVDVKKRLVFLKFV